MKIQIGNRSVGDGEPTFIIAEVGSNHNGSLEQAKKLIDVAVESGADAVKFQAIRYDELYIPEKDSEVKRLFDQIELKEEWLEELSVYCDKRGILFFATPTYLRAVDILEKLDVKLYKIASPQTATFPQLIEKIAMLKKPIIMSTGCCMLEEIDRAVKLVEKTGNEKLALLHCISEYPTKPETANLKFIQTLKQAYNMPVGFSDHTLGWEVAIAAVAMGAEIIEKHITLSRDQKAPDHFFSLEPHEFKKMITDIRAVEKSIGTGQKSQITENETEVLNKIRMKAITKRNIPKGTKLDKNKDLIFRRNTKGIDAWEIYNTGTLVLKREIKKGEPLTYEYFE